MVNFSYGGLLNLEVKYLQGSTLKYILNLVRVCKASVKVLKVLDMVLEVLEVPTAVLSFSTSKI